MLISKRKYVLLLEKSFAKYSSLLLKIVLPLDIADKGYPWNSGRRRDWPLSLVYTYPHECTFLWRYSPDPLDIRQHRLVLIFSKFEKVPGNSLPWKRFQQSGTDHIPSAHVWIRKPQEELEKLTYLVSFLTWLIFL